MTSRYNGERIRVAVINCYFDETRRIKGRPHFVPQAVGPAYLAGAFNPDLTDFVLYSELHDGPFEDAKLFSWPQMVIFTSMSTAYDRMRHLAAYFRTANPEVILVAGGPAIRALPQHSSTFFDHCLSGDVEEVQDVIREEFGPRYCSEVMIPRLDLIHKWMGFVGYVESSRNCNFNCSFCSLSGEGNKYQIYDVDYIREQVNRIGYRRCVLFVDNNFYGNNYKFFLQKIDLLKELYQAKKIGGWSALVTNDFFNKPQNVALAKESGCLALFSGVESFDRDQLLRFNKSQNLILPQVETIVNCLEQGLGFQYGSIFDPTNRPLSEIRDEIHFITGNALIPLPAFMNLTIPILRTPYFYECLEKDLLLPHTKLCDMDGNTVVMKALDPVEEVVDFLKDLPTLVGYKKRVAKHAFRFWRRYSKKLTLLQKISMVGNSALLCLPALAHNHSGIFKNNKRQVPPRTYITTTEPLSPLYTPNFPVADRYRHYFEPTMVTDANGALHEDLAADLMLVPKVEARAKEIQRV